MTERCETCRWWVAKSAVPRNNGAMNDGFGECRIRAPGSMQIEMAWGARGRVAALAYAFPMTADGDWCGEWSKRDGDGND